MSEPRPAETIVAPLNRTWFARRMLVALAILLVGGWLLYDGYVGWPASNARFDAVAAEYKAAVERNADDATVSEIVQRKKTVGNRHSDADLFAQKLFGYPAILAGLFLIARFLRDAGGELRLEGDTLHVPRHPPVPLSAITDVQNQRWERKGIATFGYTLPDGTTGRVRIDDFVYDRPPTDRIYARLLASVVDRS